MEIPSNWTLNAGDGARQLVKGMLIRQRLKTEEGWKYKLYAVSKVGEGSVTLVPVMVGGWSDSASGAVNVSPKSEVEYRKDEGAPYSEERYGATAAKGAPYRVTKTPLPITGNGPLDLLSHLEETDHPAAEEMRRVVESPTAPTVNRDEVHQQTEERKEPEMAIETKTKVAAAPVVRRPIVKKAPAESPAAASAPAETKVMRTGGAKKGAGVAKAVTPAKSPLSARGGQDPGTAVRKARNAAAAKKLNPPVTEETAGEPESKYPFTLGEVANLTGVNTNRVNSYRRAGLLPKRGAFETQGRAVMYSQRAVDAITKLEEKGTKIPAPQRGAAATTTSNGNGGAKRRGRPAKGAKSTSTGGYGALGQAIAEAEALAAKYQRRAEQLKALAADEG
jgi:hypothetical protein